MIASLSTILNAASHLHWARPSSGEWAVLVLLAATLLALRSCREAYFKLWTWGWLALTISRLAEHCFASRLPEPLDLIVVQAMFVVACGLLAAAALRYTQIRDLLMPLAVITPVLAGFAGARVLLWPDSPPLRMALEISYRLLLLTAAVALVRARRGRWDVASWCAAATLPLLHLSWTPFTERIPAAFDVAVPILMGAAMLAIVFGEARARDRRLRTIQAITTSVASAEESSSFVQSAVNELRRTCSVRAVWFRAVEGDRLGAPHATGLSADFLREARPCERTADITKLLEQSLPQVATTANNFESYEHLACEKIRHVVVVPVLGNKTPVGVLLLGAARNRRWTEDEFEFLAACARQLAIAQENFRLREQVLRSQRQWINTFESVHDVILAHDAGFRIMKANHVLLEHLGKAAADVIGTVCDSTLPRTHGDWKNCPYCEASKGDELAEIADPCFGGFSMVSTSLFSEQASTQKGTIHVVRDITDRRSAEEKYRLLFEQVQEGVYIADPQGKLLDCNDAFVRMLGYSRREELLVLNLDTEICVDQRQRQSFRQEIAAHNYVRNFDVTLRRKDGTILLALESSFATRDASGAVERYQGFVLDMTEKRRAEDEMHRRNRELNALNAMAVVAAQSFDLDEILNLTLRQVVTLFSAESGTVYLADVDSSIYRRRASWGPRSSQKTRSAEISFAEGFGDLVMRSRAEVITTDYLPHLPPKVAEFLKSDADRSWIWVLFWSKDAPVGLMGLCSHPDYTYTSSEENLLLAISRQLATTIEKVRLYEETCRAYEDLRKAQEQLLQSEKMSAVGQLIAGVAHELNNPLTAILGYAQLLESEGLNPRAEDYVGKVYKQAQRTHRIVQNLLSFARQRKPQREEVDIRKVLEETLTLRDYDLRSNNIKVERDLPPDPAVVIADAHQIEQVFLNIINNAIDAILETGRAGRLRVRVETQNGSVCTRFQDDGPGMKDPKRVFDPFFTTKSVGKGTGLGLSICYGIVKEHSGDITANNHPEGGAVIEVRMPAVAGNAIPAKPSPAAPSRPHESAIHGRILLVEEEEGVLEFERDVLAGAGAAVVTARRGEDAKTRLLSEPFDAIIMNGKMPGQWSAREAYPWVKENCAGMHEHILFTFSNGIDPSDSRAYLQENGVPFLVKPFEVADLISQARKLLQKAQAAAAGSSN